jgi:hypothetical protein
LFRATFGVLGVLLQQAFIQVALGVGVQIHPVFASIICTSHASLAVF